MAFDIAFLNPIGGQSRRGKAPQRYAYSTLDPHTTVDGSGYFNSSTAYLGAYNLLERGDIIDVVVWSGAAGTINTSSANVLTYGSHIVLDKANGFIDTSNVTTGTVTDSD